MCFRGKKLEYDKSRRHRYAERTMRRSGSTEKAFLDLNLRVVYYVKKMNLLPRGC